MYKEMNSKQKQRYLLAKIKPYCPLSNGVLSVELDVSVGLVSYVWLGVSKHKKVLEYIYNNLQEGWDNDLTPSEVKEIQELCLN